MQDLRPRKIFDIGLGGSVTRFILSALLGLAFASPSYAELGWTLKKGDNPALFAFTQPFKSNLNIKIIGFACEETNGVKALQLQVYTKGGGQLAPTGVSRGQLKDEPRAQLLVDDQAFPVTLDFAGDYALVTSEVEGVFPTLSDDILKAVMFGKTPSLRFDLRKKPLNKLNEFDSEVTVDLAGGASAIAAVRQRCAK
jgi:hypothetical protein